MTLLGWVRWLLLLVPLSAGAGQVPGEASITVDESAVRASMQEGRVRILVPLSYPQGPPIDAVVDSELVDAAGRAALSAKTAIRLSPAARPTIVSLSAPFDPGFWTESFWESHRIWYRVQAAEVGTARPDPQRPDLSGNRRVPASGVGAEGLMALRRAVGSTLILNASIPDKAAPGDQIQIWAIARRGSGTGVLEGVEVEARTEGYAGDEWSVLKTQGRTGPDGVASLRLKLPLEMNRGRLSIEVEARREGVIRTVSHWTHVESSASFLLSTDKPLYQGGQTVHMRVLALGKDKRAWRSARLRLTMKSQAGKEVFAGDPTTDSWGVATADWAVPDDAPQGSYSLEVSPLGEIEGKGFASFAVRPHELSPFSLEVEPDRSCCLPGQTAHVRIRAVRFSGEPLPGADIRVLQQTSYSLPLEETARGETDALGVYEAVFDLTGFEEIGRGPWKRRFLDKVFIAEAVEPLTGRTQHRSFRLRLTRQSIHVYLVPSASLPGGYVTTFYADGRSASCRVALHWGDRAAGAPFAVVDTNRYGVARAAIPPIDGEDRIFLTAVDRKGVSGEWTVPWTKPVNSLSVETERTLHRRGEPLKISVTAVGPARNTFLDIASSDRTLWSQRVALQDGRARVTVPYQEDFRGLLSVAVYAEGLPWLNDGSLYSATRNVVFPDPPLSLQVSSKEVYRPGDAGHAEFQLQSGDHPAHGVLGVAIVDRSLLDRDRMDRRAEGIWTERRLFALQRDPLQRVLAFGVSREDADASKTIPEDVQLVADAAFNSDRRYSRRSFSLAGDPSQPYWKTYRDVFEGQLSRMRLALRIAGHLEADTDAPPPDLTVLLGRAGLRLEDVRDPWGNPYRPVCGSVSEEAGVSMRTAGPDEAFDTDDDVTAFRVAWPYYDWLLPLIRKAALDHQLKAFLLEPLRDADALQRELAGLGVDLQAQRDPCGWPLRPVFSVSEQREVVSLLSAGPDGIAETADDYKAAEAGWRYFEAAERVLDSVVQEHLRRTGDPFQSAAELQDEFKLRGIDLDQVRDAHGNPYRLETRLRGGRQVLSLCSAGADGHFDDFGNHDDFQVWGTDIRLLEAERGRLVQALNEYVQRKGADLSGLDDLNRSLLDSGLAQGTFLDPWQRPLRLVWDQVGSSVERLCGGQNAVYGWKTEQRSDSKRGVQDRVVLAFRSAGPDGVEATEDDLDPIRIFLPRNASASQPISGAWKGLPGGEVVYDPDNRGRIRGIVFDAMGAVIPGAVVVASDETSGFSSSAISGDTGRYELKSLPAGLYAVRFEMPGFRRFEVSGVPAAAGFETPLDGVLEIGEIADYSTVEGEPQSATWPSQAQDPRQASATPRLRNYFPETLVWAPLLETDDQGRAGLDFRLPDSITEWDVAVIGSTADGRVAATRAGIRSVPPFYVQVDPPLVLTARDRVELPVIVRSDSPMAQQVTIDLADSKGFKALSPLSATRNPDSERVIRSDFWIQASEGNSEASLRVTARSGDGSDAVEKRLEVRPDGQETVHVQNRLLDSPQVMEWSLPEDSRSGTAELKIFPDALSQVFDGIEGMLQRPLGCAEQTVSSAYPNLTVLRILDESAPQSALARRARSLLEAGWQRLGGYRAPEGGFSYWGGSDPASLEVTFHAWRFLHEAQPFIDIAAGFLDSTRNWLLDKQASNGSWSHDPSLTSLAARVLAADDSGPVRQARERALDYLAVGIRAGQDDPYVLAGFVTAALAPDEGIDRRDDIRQAVRMLLGAQATEPGSWRPKSTTPFHGWGRAGQIETTAIVVRALRNLLASATLGDDPLAAAAAVLKDSLDYLLLHKGRYGAWHSTAATAAVLDALAPLDDADWTSAAPRTWTLVVNGHSQHLSWNPGRAGAAPLVVDLTPLLKPGANRLQIRTASGGSGALAHLVVRHYRDWPLPRLEAASSPDLDFSVRFDRSRLRPGEDVICRVHVRRRNDADLRLGPGMLLAEIGLPPGAEVDRTSLRESMPFGGPSKRFEVRPDRLVVYLWPRGREAVDFSFRFRPRLAMRAQTAPSTLYDYYNPDARVILPPARFKVTEH